MAVIDAHAHIYPNKIASRAVDAVGDFYLIDMFGEGTVEHLLSAQQHAPITHFIVHSVATTPGSVESINNFIDEHGGTAGIVTMSDIMEQIVGRIDDEYAHGVSDEIVQLDDGSYLIDGSLPIDEVGELIGFEPLESEECETAGGLLLTVFDRIPDEGDSVTIEDGDDRATFTVVDMDRHRIDKIRVVLEHAPESDES